MKDKILRFWSYLIAKIGLPVMVVSFVVFSYFIYAFVRDIQTRAAIDRQNARVEEYTRQSEAAVAETNRHLADFERNNLATVELLDTIKTMSGNIKKLAETDQNVTFHVADLQKNYEDTRKQKSTAVSKSKRPLREREDGVLSADTKLYPK